MTPGDALAAVGDVYDQASLEWYIRGSGPQLHPGGELATAALIERAAAYGMPEGGRILDVACALGVPGRVVARRFAASVVGVDMSPAMARACVAGAVYEQLAGRCGAVVGRTERLPFRDAAFGGAWSQDALCHMDQPPVIAEVARVLADGGVFAFSDFIARPGHTEADREALRHTWSFPHLLTLPEYVALLTAAGFEVLLAEDRTAAIARWRPATGAGDGEAWTARFRERWGPGPVDAVMARFSTWGAVLEGGRGGFALFVARRLPRG